MRDKIEIIKDTPKGKIIFGVLIVLLAAFLLYESLLEVQLKRLKAIDFKFISQKKLLDSYGRITKEEESLFNEAKAKEEDFSKIKAKFIPEEELLGYFSNFRNQVKLQNLGVSSLDFKPNDLEKGGFFEYFQKLSFNVSIKGDYFNIMSLLSKLEENKPILDIKSVRIYKENPQDYAVRMDIQATIYILKKSI